MRNHTTVRKCPGKQQASDSLAFWFMIKSNRLASSRSRLNNYSILFYSVKKIYIFVPSKKKLKITLSITARQLHNLVSLIFKYSIRYIQCTGNDQ